MFIAVSNANGWGKAPTQDQAIKTAYDNSIVKDDRVRIMAWPCQDDAWCNGLGEVFNITGEGVEYKRRGRSTFVRA